MTPSQVLEVGIAMCGTGVGSSIRYGRYNATFLDASMKRAVNQVRTYCGDPPGPPPTPFSVVGAIYQDYDRDRTRDADEPPIPNVLVTLISSRDGSVYSGMSNGQGNYTFLDLAAGDYMIAVDESTLPPGHLNTGGGAVLVGKRVVTNYDFPVRVNALLGFVYRDYNRNFLYDAGDTPYSGVTLNLINSGGNLVRVTTTDSNGQYNFRALPSDTYTITVDPSSIDSGWRSVPASRTRAVNRNSNLGGLDFAIQPPAN